MKHLKRPTRPDSNAKMLGRLGIRGKLNLLLLLPLAAVLMVATPFVIVQANSAASAGSTADSARYAREVGGLVWELQRERLLTAAYLATPRSDSQQMKKQQDKVDDTVGQVRSSLGDEMSDELASALVRIGSLNQLREGALRRGVSADSVARTYHAVVEAVIDSLRLVPQVTSDAEGTRQLTALEALLRANEYGELRGMALIATAVNKTTGQIVLDDATQQAKLFTERFVQQADVEHAALVVQVDEGELARKVDALTPRLADLRNAAAVEAFATDALNTVSQQSGSRRSVQDRVTSQITDAASARASSARNVAWLVGGGAAGLFALVAFLTVIVSRSIASPLKKLTEAASNVAQLAESELVRVSDTETAESQAPRLTEIKVTSGDEIGQLAVAFNRVQHTAGRLVERQAITRHNVSLMFANVAQRTQNLVGRQLTLIDELERNEQDSRLLERLYRLDHLSTRLRRNADNLLVVAGTRTETGLGGPTLLANAMRSALAEIEDYQRVRLAEVDEITVPSSLGTDLILVFAELLENATSFSPPDTFVEVNTAYTNEGAAVINIVDHGIGMKPAQMVEENRRLVDRERLDVAPTSVLGLFVVGRLARRHSLAVDLVPTPGGGITARVAIPAALFTRPTPIAPPPPPPPPAPVAAPAGTSQNPGQGRLQVPSVPEMRIPPAQHSAGFSWFPGEESGQFAPPSQPTQAEPVRTPAPPAPVSTPPPAPVPVATSNGSGNGNGESRSGLKRRVAGAQLPSGAAVPASSAAASTPTVRTPPVEPPPAKVVHDAAAARDAMDGFQTAFAKAASAPAPPPTSPVTEPPAPQRSAEPPRDGLTRRVPGASLAPGLRNTKPASTPPLRATPKWKARDPEAERASLDAFASGMARALVREEAVDSDPMKESRA